MSFRLALLLVYLAYAVSSGSLSKQGSGLDPMGSTPPPPAAPSQPTTDQGSGWDPWG
jgi:hypothetical protein